MPNTRRVEFCPHCGNKTPHRLVYHHEANASSITIENQPQDELPGEYFLAACETCDRALLYYFGQDVIEVYLGADDEEDLFQLSVLVWPMRGVPPSLPEPVSHCYQDALRIKQISPSAFVVQVRRALEALCDDRQAIRGKLHKRLQYLKEKGEIPPTLAEMTDVIRLLGNVGAHETDQGQELTPSEASVVDDFFRALVEYIYVAPKRLEEYRTSLRSLRNNIVRDEFPETQLPDKDAKPRIH